MARIAWAGFETGTAQELNGANNGLAVASADQARTGAYSLAVHGGPIVGASGYATDVFAATVTEFWFRMAWRINAGGIEGYPHVAFRDANGDTQLELYFNGATQSFRVYRGTHDLGVLLASGNIVLRADVWYMLEGHVVIDNGAGAFLLKVNAVTDIAVSGADTQATVVAGVRSYELFGPTSVANGELYLDDLAFNDPSGDVENSYPGLGGIHFLKAVADGDASDFTPSTGSDHYACVDDVPPNTTDWVQARTSGSQDLYEIEDTPEYITQINIVQVAYMAAVAVSGSNELRDILRESTTTYAGDTTVTVISIDPDYVLYRGQQFYAQPDGVSGAWDDTALDALQVGIEIP